MVPHEYEVLSREERLRRIGALFYKAVVISLTHKALAGEIGGSIFAQTGSDPLHGVALLEEFPLSDEDLALLRRYARLGEIAPREATEFWGVSRTTAYRRLLGLEQGGWIERRGAAKASRYILTAQTRALLERLKQIKPVCDDSLNNK